MKFFHFKQTTSFKEKTMQKKLILIGVLTLVFCSVIGFGILKFDFPLHRQNTINDIVTKQLQNDNNPVIVSIPVSDEILGYQKIGEGGNGGKGYWGITSFDVAPDGTFWLNDCVGKGIRQYDSRGNSMQAITLPYSENIEDSSIPTVICPEDIKVTENKIFVVSYAGSLSAVSMFNFKGEREGYFILDGTNIQYRGTERSLAIDEDGEIIFWGDPIYRLTTNKATEFLSEPIIYSGLLDYEVEDITNQDNYVQGDDFNEKITVGSTIVNVTENFVFSVNNIFLLPHGGFCLIEDIDGTVENSEPRRDQIIRQYDKKGQMVGVGRFPLAEQFIYGRETYISVDITGNVYYLLTKPDRIDILKIKLHDSLPEIWTTPNENQEENTISIIPVATTPAVSQDTIWQTIQNFLTNKTYLSSNNIDNSCSQICGASGSSYYGKPVARTKPRYLATSGTYTSMPYDWGGYTSVSLFNSLMKSTAPVYTAGDINCVCYDKSCSKGTDCSGFVENVWQLNNVAGKKLGCSDLNSYSTAISGNTYGEKVKKMIFGDILNSSYDGHVVVFAWVQYASKEDDWKIGTYESTTYNSYDGVSYFNRKLSYFKNNSYAPRRYNNLVIVPKSYNHSASVLYPKKI